MAQAKRDVRRFEEGGTVRLTWLGGQMRKLSETEAAEVWESLHDGTFNEADWPGRFENTEFKERGGI